MGRRVFFSFHYQDDSWRVAQVRNSWLMKGQANQFLDSVKWEAVQQRGDAAIKKWIDAQLKGTSVTVVLIGSSTSTRPYVLYEINQSILKGNGLLGIYIHSVRDFRGKSTRKGKNPFVDFKVPNENIFTRWLWAENRVSDVFKTYDWCDDNGRSNLNDWIEEAARIVGR